MLFAQNPIDELKMLFSDLGDSLIYDLDYIEEKEIIYLTFYKDSVIKRGLKMLIKDIHPEGIFLISKDGRNTIRILSIDNGHKFIEENFRNGFRLSKTTNLVDITTSQELKKVNSFIIKMKEFIASKNSPIKKDTVIDIVEPPRTKNDD